MPSGARLAVGGAAMAAACVAYGTFVERYWFRRRDHVLDGVLADGDPPLTVLHIADTHLTPPDPRLAAYVARLASDVTADLVVATGDLLGAVGSEDATVELLEPLTADGTPGLVVLGSNDLHGPTPKSPLQYFTDPTARRHGQRLDTARFTDGLHATGWKVLRDDATTLEVAGRSIDVTGLEDPHLETSTLPDPAAVTPPGGADLHLGLVHAPYVAALDLLVRVGADVLLAGHTHGGQVRLPGVGALTANCDLPLDRARGVSRWRDRWLHVTPGLGQSCYAPFRFCCRPEASVLHLTA